MSHHAVTLPRHVQALIPAVNPLQLIKDGPATVNAGQEFAFTVTVTFTGSALGVYVVDQLGTGLSFGSNAASWTGAGKSGCESPLQCTA
jgi:uncharacterized repeat protein (TIGR01451 family)